MTPEEAARLYHERIIEQNPQAEAYDFQGAYLAGYHLAQYENSCKVLNTPQIPEQKLQMATSLLEEYYKDRLCDARGMSLEAYLVRRHLLEIKKIINQLNNLV